MKKLNVLFLALLAAMMVIGFAGCKQEADSGPSLVATYEGNTDTREGCVSTPVILSVYSDNTWTMTGTYQGQALNMYKETYEGDFNKNGTVTVTMTHKGSEGGKDRVELPAAERQQMSATVAEDGKK